MSEEDEPTTVHPVVRAELADEAPEEVSGEISDSMDDLVDEYTEDPTDDGAREPTARQMALRALLHPGKGQVTAAVLLAVLGVAGVTQVRLANTDNDYAGLRQSDLIQALSGLQAASSRNERDIRDLEDTRDSLRDNNEKTATALERAQAELGSLGVLAGTLPATGPGVRITVVVPDSAGIKLNYLLDGIEELRDAGAEAMEINDSVRVVAQTSFEAADGGVNIDGKVLTSPFVIDAIGNADSLAAALKFPGGFVDDLALDEGKVTIKKLTKVEVTSLRAAVQPRYAESTQTQ